MKVVVTSDLHGYFPSMKDIPPFDLLLICGDVCPVYMPHDRSTQKEWLKENFTDWINKLPFKNEWSKVVMCAGNHDFAFEGAGKKFLTELYEKTDRRLVYLDNEEYTFDHLSDDGIKSYRIFGCPYCKVFGNWAFMRENLDKYYDFIPEGLDFLICHDAPAINELGMIKQGRYRGTDAGNTVLAKYVKERKPKYCFNGHIHSGNHEMFTEDGITFANVSSLNENYNTDYKPLEIDIN